MTDARRVKVSRGRCLQTPAYNHDNYVRTNTKATTLYQESATSLPVGLSSISTPHTRFTNRLRRAFGPGVLSMIAIPGCVCPSPGVATSTPFRLSTTSMPFVNCPFLQPNKDISAEEEENPCKNSYVSILKCLLVASHPSTRTGVPGKLSSSTGGFITAHQSAVISCNSIASLLYSGCSMIALMNSRNELVKWTKGALGDFRVLTDGFSGESNVGSTYFW